MQVLVDRGHSFTVVRPVGSFYGGSETTTLEHTLGVIIDDGVPLVVVDLVRTRDLNSTAIGVLVGAFRRALARGATFCLCGADDGLHNVLVILKLVNVIPIYPDLETALAASTGRSGAHRAA